MSKKMQIKYLTHEIVLFIFSIIQIFYQQPTLFSLTFLITLFILKWYQEGFRLPTLLLILIYTFTLFLSEYILIRTTTSLITLVIIIYFPIYHYPIPFGEYKVGFKAFNRDHLRVSIFYPTNQTTTDVLSYPHDEYWVRFYEVIKLTEVTSRGKLKYRLPKIMHKYALKFLEKQNMGVNLDASLIEGNNFPIIVFSHGLSANRHTYTTLIKEWASHGFIVLALEHDDQVLINPSSEEHYWELRKSHLALRVDYVNDLLRIIFNETEFRKNILNTSINLDNVILAGHSFGGATVIEVAAIDDRISAIIALDPWFEPVSEVVLKKNLSIPILNIRSQDFQNAPVLNRLSNKFNSKQENLLSGYYKNSTHNCMTDLSFLMPRELKIFGMLKDLDEMKYQLRYHIDLTTIFLNNFLIRETLDKAKENFKKFNEKSNFKIGFVYDEYGKSEEIFE